MITAARRALADMWDCLGRALGVDAYINRHVNVALAAGDAEFEAAARDAVGLTRDGLPIPTTGDIEAMIADCEAHLRHETRGGPAT